MRSKLGVRLVSAVTAVGFLAFPPTMARGEESAAQAEAILSGGPDFKEVLNLRSASGPKISSDGEAVLYSVSSADWEDNRYDREIWLAPNGEAPFQLTRTDGGNSSDPGWSPDGRWVTFLADRGDDRQIWLISPTGGEARPLTSVEDGVGAPVELIIYKGFGHGISKPKERLAAVWHNWRFFAERVWGESIEIPTP